MLCAPYIIVYVYYLFPCCSCMLSSDLECLDPSSILKQLCKGKVFTWCNDQDDGGCSPGISARLVTCSISKSMPRVGIL